MNEQAINQVISNFAIENANLRIQVANLQSEMESLKVSQNTEEEKGNE